MISPQAQRDLGWPQVLEHIERRCRTSRGARLAAGLELFSEPGAAERRMQEIAEARRLTEKAEPMRFGGITDVGEALARADKGSALEAEELVAVAEMARGCQALRRHILARAEAAPELAARAEGIAELAHVFGPILDSFDETGRLHDHASDALGGLRRQVARLMQALEQRSRALLDEPRIAEALQDKFWTQRDDRYVLPVRASEQKRVGGIVHGTSQSGQTIFIEPDEIVDLNNQLRLAECAAEDEERRILAELTGHVAEEVPALRRAAEIAAVLDLIAACAEMADDLRAVRPSVTGAGHLRLERARHPLMVLGGRHCVPNDIALERGHMLIVSGPNAGGKTVALKTAGLCALLVRAGLHVPADDPSEVPWFDSVLTAIGDLQSLENELSTFSAHLLELRGFFAEADAGSLVLIDELCGATEPEQGAALAQATLEALSERRVTAIVTTHYERLKALAAEHPRMANASVGFDRETMAPTFRLHLGTAGASGAIDLARRMELGADVTERAEALLGEGRASVDRLLAEAAAERDRLIEERAALASARAEAEAARASAEEAERRAKERLARAHDRAHSEAVAALQSARRELERIKGGLRRRRADELRAAEREIDAAARSVRGGAPEAPLPGKPAREADLAPGTAVFVPALGGRGRVLTAPERGQVTVQIGALKTTVNAAELRLDPSPPGSTQARRQRRQRETPAPAERRPDDGPPGLRTPDATLDLRGERVDDALAAVDRFIDQSVLAAREVIFVIHGHGTGALRQAVRSHLGGHRSIATWRAGEPGEGGDGVTVAWLGD